MRATDMRFETDRDRSSFVDRAPFRDAATVLDRDLGSLDVQQIVALVYDDWDDVHPSAATYLNALDVNDCRELADPVGNETADLQLRYFLAHAASWRGETARAVKAELRRRLGLRR